MLSLTLSNYGCWYTLTRGSILSVRRELREVPRTEISRGGDGVAFISRPNLLLANAKKIGARGSYFYKRR